MPVVREVFWPAVFEQFLLTGLGAAALKMSVETLDWSNAVLISVLAYLAFCRTMRFIFARSHTRGIIAYRAQDFDAALAYFCESFDFFSKHTTLDRFRSPLFGVSSRSPYRRIALGNIAYCYGQLGEGEKAIEYYERVLTEDPNNAIAISNLRMLNSSKGAVPRA